MYDLPLTHTQRARLRGLGQTLEPALKLGKAGLTPAFFTELQHHLDHQELVKLRFSAASDRDARAVLCEQIADQGRCLCVGAVGRTALFYRQQAHPERRVIDPGA